jgi:flavodoxin
MKALIVYQNKNNTAIKFAEAIAYQVQKRVDEIIIKSIENVTSQDIINCDLLYLGCWASGSMLLGRKPDQGWVDFVSQLPVSEGKKVVLFTSYRFTSGSIFHKMKEYLAPKGYVIIGSMKSRNGRFDYFSNGVLRYSLYQLVSGQISEQTEYVRNEQKVLEMA